MCGPEDRLENLFGYVCLEDRVPADHPLRPIRSLADAVLVGLNGRFESLSSARLWPFKPPGTGRRPRLVEDGTEVSYGRACSLTSKKLPRARSCDGR